MWSAVSARSANSGPPISRAGNVAATMVANAKMLVRVVLLVVFLAYLCGAKKEKTKDKQSGKSYELNEQFAKNVFK